MTLPTSTVAAGYVPETERRSRPMRKQEDTWHEGLAKSEGLERTMTIKGKVAPVRERGRIPLAKEKEQERMVQSHQDKRTRRRSKV